MIVDTSLDAAAGFPCTCPMQDCDFLSRRCRGDVLHQSSKNEQRASMMLDLDLRSRIPFPQTKELIDSGRCIGRFYSEVCFKD